MVAVSVIAVILSKVFVIRVLPLLFSLYTVEACLLELDAWLYRLRRHDLSSNVFNTNHVNGNVVTAIIIYLRNKLG